MPMHECVKKMYDQQRAKTGATYSSMMEGYGVLVSYMSELDAARKGRQRKKNWKRVVRTEVERVREEMSGIEAGKP